jgi:hypothetical protein
MPYLCSTRVSWLAFPRLFKRPLLHVFHALCIAILIVHWARIAARITGLFIGAIRAHSIDPNKQHLHLPPQQDIFFRHLVKPYRRFCRRRQDAAHAPPPFACSSDHALTNSAHLCTQ